MLLGRSTAQWSALYAALVSFVVLSLPTLRPGEDFTGLSATLTGSVVVVGLFIAFLANTQLTPTGDPRLAIGQVVNAGQDNQGVVTATGANVGVKEVVQVPALVIDKPDDKGEGAE